MALFTDICTVYNIYNATADRQMVWTNILYQSCIITRDCKFWTNHYCHARCICIAAGMIYTMMVVVKLNHPLYVPHYPNRGCIPQPLPLPSSPPPLLQLHPNNTHTVPSHYTPPCLWAYQAGPQLQECAFVFAVWGWCKSRHLWPWSCLLHYAMSLYVYKYAYTVCGCCVVFSTVMHIHISL